MDNNTDLGSFSIASRNPEQESRRRRRTNSSKNTTSGERYPTAPLQSPGILQEDFNPYFGTLAPRELPQVRRPSVNSISPLSSGARFEGLQSHRSLNPCIGEDCPVGFPAPAFYTSPDPPQPLTESLHVTEGKKSKKEKSRHLQSQSNPEQRPRKSSFFARFRKLGSTSASRSKESPAALSPQHHSLGAGNVEETKTRFSLNPLRNGWKGAFDSPQVLGAQKPEARQKGGQPSTLAAKFGGKEGRCSSGGEGAFQGWREELQFDELGRLPTRKELRTSDFSLTPSIARRSSRRCTGQSLGSCLLSESEILRKPNSVAPVRENNPIYSDSEYSEIEEDLFPAPLRIVKKTPTKVSPALNQPIRIMSGFLQVSAVTPKKTKAEEDAALMQASVIETANKTKTTPPPYVLLELIGKGSFGRVYKGRHVSSLKIVAVKIIDLDESDTLNPRLANTYSEFMKEVNALKILSESKARNINHVVEALPVGKAMWMITEYCGGGSIATLMKPTPSGLKERFIIPILREVAEAIKWVHQASIIHRDLKCANVLITEQGGVQLCDFGVAGITDTPLDKRSTWIGTLNWMAPELLEGLQYGKEVDIWAFGSMAYEMATGLPPNAKSGVTGPDLGPYLRQHIPRLEGGSYSEYLRSFVAYCLEENAEERPPIEAVQEHPYIRDTSTQYPTSTLSELVRAFKLWQDDGGSRRSLFMGGGAQGPSEISLNDLGDDWNFSTTAAFDQSIAQGMNAQDVVDVYGVSVSMNSDPLEETSHPARPTRQTRRRPPPEALAPLKAPLEKIFDPNTTSNYEENSRNHYNLTKVSDLPLRDDSAQTSIKDTMIDLDGHDVESGPSSFQDMDTIRAGRHPQIDTDADEYDSTALHDFSRPPLSDPADNLNRRTQDWKFPVMAPPTSANPELIGFPTSPEPQRPIGSRPALIHHPTEPIGLPSQSFTPSAPGSPTRMSLIDLDLGLPEPSRPSTADSTMSQEMQSGNPFHLEKHASLMHPPPREPSLYIPDDLDIGSGNPIQDLADVSDFSASEAEGPYDQPSYDPPSNPQNFKNGEFAGGEFEQSDFPPPLNLANPGTHSRANNAPATSDFPPSLMNPPSVAALSGIASTSELVEEMTSLIDGFRSQLSSFKQGYEELPVRRGKKRSQAYSE